MKISSSLLGFGFALSVIAGLTLATLTAPLRAQTTVILSSFGQNSSTYSTTTANPLTFDVSSSYSPTQTGVISGNGSVTKIGTGPLALTASNTYTGGTLVNAGTLVLDNRSTSGGNNSAHLADTGAITLNGGNFSFIGSDSFGTNSTETVGALSSTVGGTITVTAGSGNTATLTASSLTHTIGTGALFVNGSNLGRNTAATTNVPRLLLTNPPTLIGTTVALASGISSASKNTQIVPFLVGEATSTTGGLGTVSGTANTFLTYNATTGLRPLNPTDEFTQDALTAGTNVRVTSTATASSSVAINSLIVSGSVTLTGTPTLTITSGALLFTGGGSISGGSKLAFGSEAMVTVTSGSATIDTAITGQSSLNKSGAGTLTLNGANTYLGGTVVTTGTLALGASDRLADTGAFTINGGTLALGSNNEIVGAFSLQSGTLTGTGTLTASSFDLQAAGTISAILAGSATLTKSTSSTVTLSGANTYTGGTVITGGTLILSGANTSLGDTMITGGTLVLSGNARLSGTGAVTINGGTLALGSDVSETIGAFSLLSGTLTGTRGLSASSFDLQGGGVIDVTLFGSGSLTKSTSSTVTLTASNSYTGGTVISAGTLVVGGYFGSISGDVLNNGILSFEKSVPNITVSFGGNISGTGSVNYPSPGQLNLTGSNTYSGGTTVSGGGFVRFTSVANLGSGPVTLNGGGLTWANDFDTEVFPLSLNIVGSGTLNLLNGLTFLQGVVSSGTLTKTGNATLTFSGTNSIAGVNLDAGTLQIGAGGTSGSLAGNVSLASGTTLRFNRSDASSFPDAISGAGALAKTGLGTLTLTGDNTMSAGTTVSAGTLQIGAGGTSGSLTGDVAVASGATLGFNRSDAVNFTGLISGAGAVQKSSAGMLTLGVANTFSGGLTLTAGAVAVGYDSALGTGPLALAGGTLLASGATRTLANAVTLSGDSTLGGTQALSFTGPFTLARNRDLTVSNTALTTISGAIGESGGGRGLNKYGAGELDLTAANTYTGGTFIGEGTVRINNLSGSAFGTGAVTVAPGATLTGAGTFTGAFQNNGSYAPGNSPALVTLTSFTQGATGTLNMELGGLLRGTQYDALNVTGTISFGGALNVSLYNGFTPAAGNTFDLLNYSSAFGTFSSVNLPPLDAGLSWNTTALYTDGVLSIVNSIPEPSTYAALFGAAALGFATWRKQRRKQFR